MADASYSSTSVHSVLATIQADDIRILDDIIDACASATNFPTAYKAYTQVLENHGLDANSDGTYYTFLLKIGLLKGRTWGDKWRQAKQIYNLGSLSFDASSSMPSRVLPSMPYHSTPRESPAPEPPPAISKQRRSRLERISLPPTGESSGSSTLAHFPGQKRRPVATNTRNQHRPRPQSTPGPSSGRAYDIDEGLESLRIAKLAAVADAFRRQWLLRSCFSVWQGGLVWIQSMHAKVQYTHSFLAARNCLDKWRRVLTKKRLLDEQARAFAERKFLKSTFKKWVETTHKKARAKRKTELVRIFTKVKSLQAKRSILASWKTWRSVLRCRTLLIRYQQGIQRSSLRHWITLSERTQQMVQVADQFRESSSYLALAKALRLWYNQAVLNGRERYLVQRRTRSITSVVFSRWKKAAALKMRANHFRVTLLLRNSFATWVRMLQRKNLMLQRAVRHDQRKGERIVRTAIRHWMHRERVELYITVKSSRLVERLWLKWRQKHLELTSMNDQATRMAAVSSQILSKKAFQVWVLGLREQQSLQMLAKEFFNSRLLECAFLAWRLRLRESAKRIKQARVAYRFFMERSAWAIWKNAVMQSRLQKKCDAFTKRAAAKYFVAWKHATAKQLLLKIAEAKFARHRDRNTKRLCLGYWTKRVIDIKLRLLVTADRRDKQMLKNTFDRWKAFGQRTTEQLSLLESVQIVRNEDLLRRCFVKWLAIARSSRIRIARLEKYRAEMNEIVLIAAWEAWRGRFKEANLIDAETELQKRMRANLLFKAFLIWQSKSKNLPAVRMRSTRLKRLAWDRWRAVLPKAAREKEAREFAKKAVLRKALEKWREAFNAKMRLRTTAKSRYQQWGRGAIPGVAARRLPPAPPLTSTTSGLPASGSDRPGVRLPVIRPRPAEEKTKAKSVDGPELAQMSEARRELWRRLRGA